MIFENIVLPVIFIQTINYKINIDIDSLKIDDEYDNCVLFEELNYDISKKSYKQYLEIKSKISELLIF
jgi:hypothetical protein